MRDEKRELSVADGDACPAAPKRPYTAPKLIVHGSVETVTQRGRGRGRGGGQGHTTPPGHQH